MKNNEIYNKMIESQQETFQLEHDLVDAIESWFQERDIKVSARLLEYNYIRIWSTDEKMCTFDMTDFCDEFNVEIKLYRHGFQWAKYSILNEGMSVDLYWMFEIHIK